MPRTELAKLLGTTYRGYKFVRDTCSILVVLGYLWHELCCCQLSYKCVPHPIPVIWGKKWCINRAWIPIPLTAYISSFSLYVFTAVFSMLYYYYYIPTMLSYVTRPFSIRTQGSFSTLANEEQFQFQLIFTDTSLLPLTLIYILGKEGLEAQLLDPLRDLLQKFG